MDETQLTTKVAATAFWALPSLLGAIIAAWLHLAKTKIGMFMVVMSSCSFGIYLHPIILHYTPWLSVQIAQLLTSMLGLFIIEALIRGIKGTNLATVAKSWITKKD